MLGREQQFVTQLYRDKVTYLSIYLSIYLFIYLPVYVSMYLCIYLIIIIIGYNTPVTAY